MANQNSIICMYSSGTNNNAITLLRYLSTQQADDSGPHFISSRIPSTVCRSEKASLWAKSRRCRHG